MTEKKKYYVLPMFTYPSGYGLHVGHASNFSITDFVARQKKMQGYDVLYPTGYDSFGLPTENFAIKQGRSADEVTKEACEHFTEQMKECEFDFDWTKMFATSDPEYYKRTQWIFTKLFEHGLVYKKDGLVNRCNGCQTVLANDQVVDGKCERCETIIIQKKHPQRYIKITDYADKLLDDMEFLTERPEETKTHQRNWIGRSEGTEIDFIVTSNLLPVTSNVNTQETKNYIICDFDGVIGDSFETIAKAMEQMDNFGGIKFDVHSAMEHIRSYARKLPDHTKKTTLSEDELKRLTLDVKNMGKATHDLGFGLHREFIDTIKSLPNAHIAVVSSGSEEYVQPAVIQSGLEASHILCFEDHHSKEEKIENICKDWGVSIEDIYYITDSLADVYELKGFLGDDKIIGVTRGQCTRQELEEELASNQIIDNQKDITRYFRTETAESATTEPRTKNQEPRTITVFTTRPDTLYGVTAIVLAPENQIIDHLLDNQKHQELTAFRHIVSKLTSIDRQSTDRQKNGLSSGVNVRHPLTDELIPVRFADYVLADYATGSVMFVPAHDERDREFAKRYDIPIKQVIVPEFGEKKENAVSKQSGYGIVFNPKSNKYLCVYGSAGSHYGAHGLEYGFPGGSIDDGEDILQGTIREVTEETGYDDLILHEALGIETISHYFAHNKNTQRENKAKTYFFILNSEHQNVQHLEKNESGLVCERLSEEELQSKPLLPIRKRIFDAFQGKVITEGALINSDKFNGLDSEAAKTVISDYLTSIGRGRKKTTFRLRDWSVSRQRYRGSPIPIYYTFADNQKVPYYTSRDGFPESYGNWTQPGKPVITRHNAKVIIKHWSEEKYLLLHNETFGYHLVGGGIDEGETYSQAAIREAKEETPFENFKLLQELPGEVHNDFYQPRKQENRYLIEHFVALQLESDMQSETHLESHESFAYHWVAADKMGGLLQYRNEQHGWYQRYDPTQVPTHKTIDRYNAYNPHPDKTKRIPHAIPESELPIILPLDLPNYKPAGKSPLEDHPTFKYYHKKEIIGLDRSTIDQRRIQTMLGIYSTIRSSTKNLGQETYLIGGLGVAVVSGFVFRKNDDLDLIISGLSLNQIKELGIGIGLEFKEQTNHTVRFEYKSIEIEVFSSEGFVEYSKNTMIVDYSQINTNEINFMDTNIRVFDKGFYLEFKKRVNNYYKNNGGERQKDLLDIEVLERKPYPKVPYMEYSEGNKAFREGLPVKPRPVAVCIVKDKDSDSYGFLQWSHDNDVTAFFGGVEDNENPIDTCIRELKEEGGFTNSTFKQYICEYHCKFYHPTKHHNQYSINSCFLFEVDRNAVQKTSDEEQSLHHVVWMSADEFLSQSKNMSSIFVLQTLLNMPVTVPISLVEKYNEYNPKPVENLELGIHNSESDTKIPYFLSSGDTLGPKKNEPTKFKRTNLCVVRNTKTNKYLMIERCNNLGIWFTGGIIENNENIIESGKRELEEETGVIGLIYKRIIGDHFSYFYHSSKKVNFATLCTAIYFETDTENLKDISAEELVKQKPMWLTEEEIRVKTDADVNIYYLDFVTGKHPIPPAFIDRYNEHNPYHEISKEEEKVEPGKVYLRECDTLDTFMCSSFYYLRFCDPHNTNQIISDQAINYMPIDLYVGGKEHSVGHLIYARFIYKFLRDYGYIKHDFPEPFKKLVHQGMIHGADGRKMSKRWGNIIDPLDVIKEYNADTMRTYLAFMGPVELQKNRNPDSVAGVHRFLKRFEKLTNLILPSPSEEGEADGTGRRGVGGEVLSLIHQTIKGFSEDMDNLKFNTAISKLMIACNSITESGSIDRELLSQLVLLLAPFAPALCQTMWTRLGHEGDVTTQPWPTYNSEYIQSSTIELPIQINGKTKGNIHISRDGTQEQALQAIQQDEKLSKHLSGPIKKIIRVPGRICNIIL